MKNKIQFAAAAVLGIAVLVLLLANTTTTVLAKRAVPAPNAQATATTSGDVVSPTVTATTATVTAATPTASAASPTEEAMVMDDAAMAKYCTDKGGTVTERYPTYNTNAPKAQWITLAGDRDFCTFHAEADSTGFQSQISIALDTLTADKPTLAVLAYLEPLALPEFTGANPSVLYCNKLGGTDIWGGQNNSAGGGWVTEADDSATNFQVVGMCVFPDGSAIDSWGLAYKAGGVVRGTDLSKVVMYQPAPADLPNVFVNGSSPNSPAEVSVDKTLTDTDNKSDVALKVGDTLTVMLHSNPSTGYSWKLLTNDGKVLEAVGEPQFDLGGKTPVPGAGGTETFTFNAVAKGTTTVTLNYVRPWETNVTPTPNDVWTVNVTVE